MGVKVSHRKRGVVQFEAWRTLRLAALVSPSFVGRVYVT